ncbi:TrmB family transcriptional regulator [Providencia huaxiensis]|uniref:TrmB family transcriptional regulator n=1 Tax=Providencia huaxiensis TaxID=2027290 RepID=UPI001EFD3C46|nr:TrmB family transcriptional regulator [Providencia huaxiensis]MCG9536682.1 TrmB family transcriptional regulator [Providencia huaxiensis]
MLKQTDMTEEAKIVLEVVPHSWWASIEEISSYTELAKSRCQLILTQLAMAGLIKENTKENTFQNI